MIIDLTFADYQIAAKRTDKTRGAERGKDVPVLGLFGEVGSLLSEVKKKQRDTRSYTGYEQNVVEELGDVLWYFTIIADRMGLQLEDIAKDSKVLTTNGDATVGTPIASLQQQGLLPFNSPSPGFEHTLIQLAIEVGRLVQLITDQGSIPDIETTKLSLTTILEVLVRAANEAGVQLVTAANKNLAKTEDRWPSSRKYPKLFDENFPPEEQLPRKLTIDIYERVIHPNTAREKRYVLQRCNDLLIGDRLTDNILKQDYYRFHDVFHYAYAAILGWSPVTRALFKRKRKSEPTFDEAQDGARAILIEEGISTYIFGQSKMLDFFDGYQAGDLSFSMLKTVKEFVQGYEPEACPTWLWEEAILRGNQAFRFLRQERKGRVVLDMEARSIGVLELSL